MTLENALAAFILDQRLKGNTDKTIRGYQGFLGQFINWLFKCGIEDITVLELEHVRKYQLYIDSRNCDNKNQKLTKRTVRTYMRHIRIFLAFCYAENMINEPIHLKIKLPKAEKPIIEILTDDDVDCILSVCDVGRLAHRDRAIVCLLLDCGLRRSEVLGLKWGAVDFENNKIKINHTVVKNLTVEYKNKTKTSSSTRTLDLLVDVKDMLLKLKKQQAEDLRTFGKEYHKSDYIFKYADGSLFRPDSTTRSFQRVLKNHELSEKEYSEIKKHPLKGAQILSAISMFKDIVPLVKQHHERLDGKGYPEGLKGNEINFLARIITVSDAFDAMMSDRMYRSKLSMEESINQLKQGVGTQFDETIVSVFIKILENYNEMGKEFAAMITEYNLI